MPSYPFMQVDAFTDKPLDGNPCAILFDTDEMDDATMLAIARENNLSETSFVRRSEVADFGVRYWTPAEEVPLAGHPTIATAYALVDSGRVTLTGDVTRLTLELRVGPIPVEIVARDGKVQRITMSQKKPQFLQTYDAAEVMPIFGLSEDDVIEGLPVQTVSTGTPQLMIPVRDIETLKRVTLNIGAYIEARRASDYFSAHLFALSGVTDAGDVFARHFVTPPDLIEDPFTGSASGGMGAYLWRYGLIEQPAFVTEQGHWMGRPGLGYVEAVGPRDDIETVRVGGNAVTVIEGTLRI